MTERTCTTVFYSDNFEQVSEGFVRAAVQAIKAVGLTPITYVNIKRDGVPINLHPELSDDFSTASAVVLLLGPADQGRFPIEDHWVLAELAHVTRPVFVYLLSGISRVEESTVRQRKLPSASKIALVAGPAEFAAALEADLRSLLPDILTAQEDR